jgi:xanthine dehydrogenase D subunit
MTVETAPPTSPQRTNPDASGAGIGQSAARPDGVAKVTGNFAYSSDLWAAGMLWGTTLRSPHASARIRRIDVSAALAVPGVAAVLTHADVPGRKTYGLLFADQPVLAVDRVRYIGEPVAIVAADHPETARRAAAVIRVDYESLPAVFEARAAAEDGAPRVHDVVPDPGRGGHGNVLRRLRIKRGRPESGAPVVVRGEYEIGMQDQAFLGPESGLAVPAEDGGVDLYVATQALHVDQDQIAEALRLPQAKVRVTLAGVGGAFGAREDLSMQIHACLLALRTGRPVKMMYSREESFVGHVHRHPAWMCFEHGADYDGRLVYVKARILLDGGAYASCSSAVTSNAACFAVGPYVCDNVDIEASAVYTNNPPCGAMRGFGSVQACFGYESQMDRLAAALGIDPVELRIRNAMSEGSRMPTGQLVTGPAPVAELLRIVRGEPLPPPARGEWPGGLANTTHGEGVRRGIGYAVGIKNNCYAEGADDYATARVQLEAVAGRPVATVHTAAVEVGQGLVTVVAQIARTELGITSVVQAPPSTSMADAGSSSASRQTYCTGGAVRGACELIRSQVLERAAIRLGVPAMSLRLLDDQVAGPDGPLAPIVDLLADEAIDVTHEFHHRATAPLTNEFDPDGAIGQGDAHVQFAFAAHRVVADVDVDLGLVRLVEITTAQDVGKALNPQSVLGQIHGGTVQGVGLALMEEIQLRDGKIRNASFTDYLIPTILDVPPMKVHVLELADPDAPYGLRGVGEPPTVSSTPAVVAAVRAATGRALTRIPLRPEYIVAVEGSDSAA